MTIRMGAENDHSACVHAWLARTKDLPAERLIQVFEHGFDVLWARAYQTLGDVTLTAIIDRVLFTAAEQFPDFSSLRIQSGKLQCEDLRKRAQSLEHDRLEDGIRFVLVEFLTVLGNLTAEILTPALHSELSNDAPLEGARAALLNPESDGEGAKS